MEFIIIYVNKVVKNVNQQQVFNSALLVEKAILWLKGHIFVLNVKDSVKLV